MSTVENWRACVGFPGYEVSDHGRVRSLPRVINVTKLMPTSGRIAVVAKHFKGRILRPGRAKSGHLQVALSGKTAKVHHLVLTAFVGPCPPGLEGCHFDDKEDLAREVDDILAGNRDRAA